MCNQYYGPTTLVYENGYPRYCGYPYAYGCGYNYGCGNGCGNGVVGFNDDDDRGDRHDDEKDRRPGVPFNCFPFVKVYEDGFEKGFEVGYQEGRKHHKCD